MPGWKEGPRILTLSTSELYDIMLRAGTLHEPLVNLTLMPSSRKALKSPARDVFVSATIHFEVRSDILVGYLNDQGIDPTKE
jgi:hypothetical protein